MAWFKKWRSGKKKDPEALPAEAAEAPLEEEEEPAGEDSGLETEPADPPPPAPEPQKQEEPQEEPEKKPEKKKRSAWSILRRGLEKTRQGIAGIFSLGRAIDEELVDEIQDSLIAADFGPETVTELIEGEDGLRKAWKDKKLKESTEVRDFLKDLLKGNLKKRDNSLLQAAEAPTVILVSGVNGTGKTTSIAKLAHRLSAEGKTVILAAADTFRAAAVEQLTIWSQRLGIEIVTGEAESDPASVAYRAAEQAAETGADYLIVDTAGRLHTQTNLMKELSKIRNVLEKKISGAPHESLLVLDATTGQNALLQASHFLEAVQVSGIVLTKLDGTAKGGIVVAINNRLQIPVKFIGVGEQVEDLEAFNPDGFVDALLDSAESTS
jgi:fused signal recognition particle receptor